MTLDELKLGIYEKAMAGDMTWAERLNNAADAGYRFVEISIDENDQRMARLDWDKNERKRFAETVAYSGLSVPSMCLSGHRRFPFGSHNPDIRAKAHDLMEKAIGFAVDTGIRTIQLAGYDVYYEDGDSDTEKWFLDGLCHAVDLASRENVMLAMEIMDHPFMCSIVRYLNIRNKIRSPWFAVYPDLGNLSAWGNDVSQELCLGLEHIVAIHLKDTLAVTSDFPGKFKEVPFGEGCVDFTGAFRTLKNLEYKGPFLVEMWTEKAENPIQEIRGARNWILDRMEAAGYLERSGNFKGGLG